jgi:hypothetical protein
MKLKMMNEFPLVELTEEALKENTISLLGAEYSALKEKELLDCFFENERYITSWQVAQNQEFAVSILGKFNNILNFHGVEFLYDTNLPALQGKNILYCNSGDTYDQTILWFDGCFYIGDWGSLLEWLEIEYCEDADEEYEDEEYENDEDDEDVEALDDEDDENDDDENDEY